MIEAGAAVGSWACVFRREDGRSVECRDDPHLADLAALLAGVKPVVYANVDEAAAGRLGDLAALFGLRWRLEGEVPGGKRAAFLAREPAALERAAAQWRAGGAVGSNPDWSCGTLGYPPCCVEHFVAGRGDGGPARRWDIVRSALARSGPGPYPFVSNNLFNLSSRLDPRSPDLERSERLGRLNPAFPVHMLHVVPWHPCRYDCPATAADGRRIAAVLETLAPGVFEEIRSRLARAYLYLDKWRFAALDGRADGGSCRYRPFDGSRTLLSARDSALLRRGDLVELARGSVEVFRADRLLGRLRAPAPVLLDFST